MKIVFERDTLIEALNSTQRAVSTKTSLNALEGILIDARTQNISITANNLEMAIETIISGMIIDGGAVVVSSKLFGDIIRKMPNTEIIMEVTQSQQSDRYNISIMCEKTVISMTGMDASEFPKLPEIEQADKFILSALLLKKVIRKTSFAASTNDMRRVLTGLLFLFADNQLEVAGVDGYRLATYVIPYDTDQKKSFVVPRNVLTEISKILKDDEGDVEIFVTPKLVMFKYLNITVISRLLEGEFMNYKSVVPTDFTNTIEMNSSILLDGVERCEPLLSGDISRIPIVFDIIEGEFNISATSPVGSISDTIKTDSNITIRIGFNARYMLEALRTIETESINISFNSPLSPCVITSHEDKNFLYMILPVRL